MSRDQWRVSSHTSINGKETISLLTVQLLWLFTYSTVMKGLAYLDKGHRFPNLWDSGTSIVLVHPTVGTTGTNNAENTQMVLVVWIFKFFLKYYAEPHSWRSPGPSGRLGGVPTPLAPTLVRKDPNLTTLIAPPLTAGRLSWQKLYSTAVSTPLNRFRHPARQKPHLG